MNLYIETECNDLKKTETVYLIENRAITTSQMLKLIYFIVFENYMSILDLIPATQYKKVGNTRNIITSQLITVD